MRVLHVINGAALRVGGSAVFAAGLCRALAAKDIDVTLLATDQATVPDSATAPRATTSDLPPDAEGLDFRLFATERAHRLCYCPALGEAIRAEVPRADIVHVHNFYLYPQITAERTALRAGRPYVVSPHGVLNPWLRNQNRARKLVIDTLAQRRLLDKATALHFLTSDELSNGADVAPEVPRIVAPSGLSALPAAAPGASATFRDQLPGDPQAPLILSTGRVADLKGIDILIDALALVRAEAAPTARLAVVGPDDEGIVDRLSAQAAAAGLAGALHFCGPLYGADLSAALGAGDVWALASRSESFGIAAVEACAAGLPVVCSPGVGVGSTLAEGGAAVTAERAPEAFAQELGRLLTDRAWAQQLSAAGPEVAARFTWSVAADAMAAGYAECIERTGRR